MVSSGGRLGADLMKQVTQRPADTVELFFFFPRGKKNQEEGEEGGREDVVKSANKYKKLLQRGTNSLDSRVLKNKMGNTMVKF